MKGFKVFTGIWLGLLLVFIMACASSTSNVGIGEFVPTPEGDHAFTNSIVINNQELSRHLQIVDLKGRMVNDLMEAQVQVINKYDRAYNFEYKFQWYDQAGFEVRSIKDQWKPVLIYGQETKTLVGIAPTAEALKFRINIRAANPVR